MKMELNALPVVDWKLAVKLAGNQKEVAEEMLKLLVNGLPGELATIQQCHQSQKYNDLQYAIHKLHGAVAYCGVPRLKLLLAQIEADLKIKHHDDLSNHINLLEAEVRLLLEASQQPFKN